MFYYSLLACIVLVSYLYCTCIVLVSCCPLVLSLSSIFTWSFFTQAWSLLDPYLVPFLRHKKCTLVKILPNEGTKSFLPGLHLVLTWFCSP